MPDFLKVMSTAGASNTLTFSNALTTVIVTFILGIVISMTYKITYKKGQHSQNFMLTLVMIPSIIAIIILLVGSNIARAFSLAGAFSIIRFRSAASDPKDISYVFFTMAAGLACGSGFMLYAIFFTILLCLFMIILCNIDFGGTKSPVKQLKIVIAEDLDYPGIFDDIFKDFTVSYELKTVKTIDLGSLFELIYIVNLKENINEKKFIDALRCRNGNLTINLSYKPEVNSY